MPTSPELAALESQFGAVALALPRVAAVFTLVPFLTTQMIPGLARAGLILMTALFMAPAAADMPPLGISLWVLVAAKEALIGTLLGLGFCVFIWALQSVGELVDLQTGSSNAAFFDPLGGHQGGPTSQLLGWLVITLFVSAGGLAALLAALADSYRLWPVASFFPRPGPVLEQFAVRKGDIFFLWTVKLAAPVILVLLLAELGMGLVSRMAPQLNVFVFAQPLKSLLAVLMLLLFLGLVYDALQGFMQPDNGVLAFLRAAL
ncbi:MAG TPA: type III secretion system export apparatus subunit SctT [Burkholderiaceae bacterium]|nr:type III secretion system export apparatus subunit SctT [Burkholderiaceae bacterium]